MAGWWSSGGKERRPPHPHIHPQGSLHRTAPMASLWGQASLTGSQTQEELFRASHDVNGVLGLLARCQALPRETRGSALALQVQIQGHSRLEGSQDGHGSHSPRRKKVLYLQFHPCLSLPPRLAQAGSWFSSYSFSFSFSKLLALGST